MKIKVKDILAEGIEVADRIPAEAIGLTAEDAGYFPAPLEVRAALSRQGNMVLAKTHVQGRYKTVCSRCLADLEREWQDDFLLDFPVGTETETIELDEDIRQEVILNLPQKVLCREDCKGICHRCGADLNTEKCKCKG